MIENFINYNSYIENIDVKSDKIPDGINENNIKEQAKKYVEIQVRNGINKKDLDKLLDRIKILLEKQDIEKLNLQTEFENNKQYILTITKQEIPNESLIAKIKNDIYASLGIDIDLNKNNDILKFVKGLVDGVIINNIETLKQIVDDGVDNFINSLKELLSITGLIEFINSVKEDIVNLEDILNKPYEGGIAIGGLGLGIFGKGLKGLKLFRKAEKVEHKMHVPHNGVDLNKVDFLEMKGKFSLSKIPNLQVAKAKELIESFANKIDVKYLINNPKRISDMLDIVDSMCDYINKNASSILKLQPKDLNDFRYVFGELRKNLGNLGKDDSLGRRKIDIFELKDGKMKDTITILNPNLLPKK